MSKKSAPQRIRKCAHDVYWPADQEVAHGCSFCNPQEPDLTPEKTFAIFRIKNRSALAGIPLHSYGTKIVFGRGWNKQFYWYSAVDHV
jgi:hypothetical protein